VTYHRREGEDWQFRAVVTRGRVLRDGGSFAFEFSHDGHAIVGPYGDQLVLVLDVEGDRTATYREYAAASTRAGSQSCRTSDRHLAQVGRATLGSRARPTCDFATTVWATAFAPARRPMRRPCASRSPRWCGPGRAPLRCGASRRADPRTHAARGFRCGVGGRPSPVRLPRSAYAPATEEATSARPLASRMAAGGPTR
jgi:hypothetical protein